MNVKELIAPIVDADTKKVSLTELSLILQKIDGSSATQFWMVIETEVKLVKKFRALKAIPSPFAKDTVTKLTRYTGMLNFNYTNSVNNQLEREGKEADFQAQANWHTKKYDEFNGCVAKKVEGNQTQEYLFYKDNNADRLAYLLNGFAMNAEQTKIVKRLLPKYSATKSQGTDEVVLVKTVKLQNIRILRVKGVTYEVVA